MRKLLLILSILLMSSASVFSQTMMLKPFGVSPRFAESDTTDMFDRAFSGELNVGVETEMYFQGMLDGASLTSPVFSVTLAPENSIAVFGVAMDVDTSTQIAAFIPDVVGTYVLTFTDGSYTASVTVNSGLYEGMVDGGCTLCHNSKYVEWQGTGHSIHLKRGLNGTLSSHYGPSCISCHTVGFDVNANNQGFDDREFVFPDTLFVGQYDSMLVAYPDAMKLANIQCESCHGPGSEHHGNKTDNKIAATYNSKNCAVCHDEGTHHLFPAQYDISRHANPLHPYTRASCAACHNGKGFVDYVESGKQDLTVDEDMNVAITCATCHDPHSAENEHQLRTVEVTLGNGVVVDKGDNGVLCMNCHKSRRNAAEYTGPDFRYSKHFGPHHGPQADMLMAANVPTFGKKLPTSPHISATDNACVDCHMYPGHVDVNNNVILVGSHTFNVVDPDGNDNVAICNKCHGDIGTSFSDKKYYRNGSADLDGNGVEEGLQIEVEGMLNKLAMMLPPIDSAAVDMSGKYIYSETEVKAAYNYFFVEEDGSQGIHNPAFTVALLDVSMQAVKNNAVEGGIVSIQDVPNDQGKNVTIIWNKFIDDGVSADPIASYTVKRFDGDTTVWTGVGSHTADGSARYALVVPTLYDSTADGNALTQFKVVALSNSGNVFVSDAEVGYSMDNLVPEAPANPTILVQNKTINLAWDASVAPDVNFYRVYRSTSMNFVPTETEEIGTTAEVQFNDDGAADGTYYYKIAAVDFSGNLGEFSAEVSVKVTAIDGEGLVPTAFSLDQNYPNPFNPTTTIGFSVKTAGMVNLTVFNAVGQKIAVLVDKELAAGPYSTNFDGTALSSGVYFYQITISGSEHFSSVHKMMLMK